MKFSLIITFISLFGFFVHARGLCSSYLSLSKNDHVFVLQADNYTSKSDLSQLHWSMLDSSSTDVEVQKYIPEIIELIFKHNEMSLDDELKIHYTFLGAPKIEIRINFNPDGDIQSGTLKYITHAYLNNNEMTSYYLKTYGSLEAAHFAGAINTKETFPWNSTIYFVGSHDDSKMIQP